MRIPIIQNDVIIRGELEMNLSFVSLRRAAGICLAVLLFLVCNYPRPARHERLDGRHHTDVQGGAISGARLRAVNSDTGLKLESVSDENGFVSFSRCASWNLCCYR